MNQILFGDCRDRLAQLATAGVRVQTCVTSPPNFRQSRLQETPEHYIDALVSVFRGVRNILTDDGTLWLHVADASHSNQNAHDAHTLPGIPWMLAFALRADGWYLRQDIILSQTSPSSETVTGRCTDSHQYLFLLTKSPRYVYDHTAIKEPAVSTKTAGNLTHKYTEAYAASDTQEHRTKSGLLALSGVEWTTRNRRTVWPVNTLPDGAPLPADLIELCILAGSRPAGKRCDCNDLIHTPTGSGVIVDPSKTVGRAGMSRPRKNGEGSRPITKIDQRHHAREIKHSIHRADIEALAGPGFAHYIRTDANGARPLPEKLRRLFLKKGWITDAPVCICPIHPADIVLDPFGAGLTATVAILHGRQYRGCERHFDCAPPSPVTRHSKAATHE